MKKNIIRAKLRLLELYFKAGAGHVGGSFSCLEALLVLYLKVMQDKDRFILSKGHAAGAWYVTLWLMGKINDELLDSYSRDSTMLPGHPSGSAIPGLLFPTGSLGHGPSLSAGLALAAKYQKTGRNIYCICSDGEWQEGSCWEALTFAVHKKLDNLTILVDQNGLQGFGTTEDVISVSDLAPRFSIFGANVVSTDGHDHQAILEAINKRQSGLPQIVVLRTRKGNGIPDFENQMQSHYLPLTKEQYERTCQMLREERP